MSKASLPGLFGSMQQQLAATLETCRLHATHPGAKGDATELNWLEMLRNHLPRRYCAEKAFVVDTDGELSDQIDIVLFDGQYSPLIFHQAGLLYIPAESVYAVLEIKQTLNKGFIEYAGQKAASVRRLRRTSAPIHYAAGVYAPKTPYHVVAGILSLESEWTPGLGDALIDALSSLEPDQHLELGCCLRHGAFEMPYGKVDDFCQSKPESSLVFFLLHLLHNLQQLGTAVAPDLLEYASWLDKDARKQTR
jgi:hypothetical protein